MDMIPPFIYLFLALGCLAGAVGIIIWIVGYFRGRGIEDSQEQEKEKEYEQPPTAAVSAEPDIPPAKPEAPMLAGDQELLHVLRTLEGDVVICVRGQRYHHLQEIKDARAERDAAEALHAMLAFAEGWLPALRYTPPQSPPDKAAMQAAFLELLRQSDLFASAPHGALDSLLSGSGSVIAAVDRSIRDMVSSPSRDSSLLTPADQINRLVQQRLKERPDLKKHGIIRLSTGKDGGLRFHVGLHTFETVDDITVPEVRELIQDAIREWRGD